MITPDDITLIDKFINEDLEPLELRKFQLRIRDELDFSQEVRKQIAAVKGIKSFAAASFVDQLTAELPSWKAEGHDSYKPSMDGTKILLWIFVPAIIFGLSYAIFRLVSDSDRHAPKAPINQQDTAAVEEVVTPSPEPIEASILYSTSEADSVTYQLKILDPKTYSTSVLSDTLNTIIIEVSHDGSKDTLTSNDTTLLQRLEQIVVPDTTNVLDTSNVTQTTNP